MEVHRSNRTEQLAEELARIVVQPGPTPFEPEWIGIQGRGMERWLTLELSRRLGVWANPRFLLPRELVDEVLERGLGKAGLSAPYTEECLQWTLARLLGEPLPGPDFAPLRRYLEVDEEPALRRIELAGRIATTFDRYGVYRPDLLLGWEAGEGGSDWQPELWRRIVAHHGAEHAPARAQRFCAGRGVASEGWPARIHVFGVSTLPPLHLAVLRALSEHTELHLYILTPTREFYADTRSERELARVGEVPGDEHWDVGHPLVASLGRLGREFQQLLEGEPYRESGSDGFRDPMSAAEPSMLAVLQSDMLALAARGEDADRPPRALAPDDASIRVHSCHGALREIEVLHDQLLALFEAEPGLAPHDVVVMAPDIDAYAPFVEAVFGAAGGEGAGTARIPFRIADRSVRRSLEGVEAFCRWLDAIAGRLRASEVMDLLALSSIRRRYGIEELELDRLREWVADAGIRWGADARHRAAVGQPAEAGNTWRLGLDRLWLGQALPDDDPPFEGVLGRGDALGQDVQLLGRLGEFVESLLAAREELRKPRSLAAWQRTLNHWLDRVIDEQAVFEVQAVREQLAALAEAAAQGGFDELVPLEVVRRELEHGVSRKTPGHDFLSGAVTFCELVPMRSIPFAAVALVGLGDERFPRRDRALGFDHLRLAPRPGDRSVREEDRQLFLEALLSARRRLLVTYVGQNPMDNGRLPPSVVVSELLDVLERGFRPEGEGSVRDQVLVEQPLQPFDPRCFEPEGPPALRSFDMPSCRAARVLAEGETAPFVFGPGASAPERLPAPAEPLPVALDRFESFFRGPARAFCQRRLGLYLGDDLPMLEDREPIELLGLDRWKLGQQLLERVLAGDPLERAVERARAEGVLPPGSPGRLLERELRLELLPLLERAVELRRGAPREPLEVDRVVGPLRLQGTIGSLWPQGRSEVQFARLGNRGELVVWLRHLLWGLVEGEGVSTLIGRAAAEAPGRCLRLAPVESPASLLEPLAELYQRGQDRPVALHPRSSRAFAERWLDPSTRDKALDRARLEWTKGLGLTDPESDDPYERQLHEQPEVYAESTFDDDEGDFAEIARVVFGPLLAHREIEP